MFSFHREKKCDLFKSFCQDEKLARAYFALKMDEFAYPFFGKYSFDHFFRLIQEVNKLHINQSVLKRFKTSLRIKLDETTAQKVIDDLLAGRPLTKNGRKVFTFSTKLEKEALLIGHKHPHNAWGASIKSLLICSKLKETPATLKASLEILDDPRAIHVVFKLKKLFSRLDINNELKFRNFQAISRDLRHSLRQKYQYQKKKKQLINRLSEAQIIIEYLENYLPKCPATKEWKKLFLRYISFITKVFASRSDVKKKVSFLTNINITFLDKNEDLFRTLRFADAASNCFNSGSKKFKWIWNKRINWKEGLRKIFQRICLVLRRQNIFPIGCVAGFIKDPLSFIIDITEFRTNRVFGFVIGRMGLNPVTNRPIIMLSGIYMDSNNPIIIKNVLKILELNIGQRLAVEAIILPKQFPHYNLHLYTKYRKRTKKIFAIRALSNRLGMPVKRTFDDLGDVANGLFLFKGYTKQLLCILFLWGCNPDFSINL